MDQRFDQFWKMYPRKVGKGAAEKMWGRIKEISFVFPQILKAVEDQKRSTQWRKDQGAYIPYPATWLNQKRWLDEVDGEPVKTVNQEAWDQRQRELDRIRERDWENRQRKAL